MDLYIHYPVRLHGVALKGRVNFTFFRVKVNDCDGDDDSGENTSKIYLDDITHNLSDQGAYIETWTSETKSQGDLYTLSCYSSCIELFAS
jgi:hypothetical protein